MKMGQCWDERRLITGTILTGGTGVPEKAGTVRVPAILPSNSQQCPYKTFEAENYIEIKELIIPLNNWMAFQNGDDALTHSQRVAVIEFAVQTVPVQLYKSPILQAVNAGAEVPTNQVGTLVLVVIRVYPMPVCTLPTDSVCTSPTTYIPTYASAIVLDVRSSWMLLFPSRSIFSFAVG
jgi:hypothetical protein